MKRGYQGNVVLVELIVVVLFFSLSAVISLGVFVQARSLELESSLMDDAAATARNWCEELQYRPDAETFLTEQGFWCEGDAYTMQTDSLYWRCDISREDTEAGALLDVIFFAARNAEDEALTTLSTTCYHPGEVQ